MATTHKKKKISKSDIIGEQGIALIHQRVSAMGHLWHPTGVEAGIDGFIEIRDDVTDEVSGYFVPVQSKASNTERYTAEKDSAFEYLCNEVDLNYWLNSNTPVVLIVSRPKTNEVYWACIRDRFKEPSARKTRRIVFDKTKDRFDNSAKAEIAKLAIPKESGFYLAPPPKSERLFSNLLGVSKFAKHIYIAETAVQDPRQIWENLRMACERPSNTWVLSNNKLASFHDLKVDPWGRVCDRGSVEVFDVDEFAHSLDAISMSTFTRLIYEALREKLWENFIRYDRKFRYYHFIATKDLRPREVHYQSLEKNTSRIVFAPYYHKKELSKVRYYRHHAFTGTFRRFDAGWYLEITPTYRYTSDGRTLYPYYEDELAGIKRLENNQAVLGQVVMWANLLSRPADLFDRNPFIEFGELKAFDLESGVFDNSWLKQEDPEADENDTPFSKDNQLGFFEA